MNIEDIKKIAREEFMNNVMERLDSVLIFAYIQNLENQLQQKENIIKEIREYVRSKEWAKDYEKSSCRTHILVILDKENK